jgi:alkylated DNA repair dioxygenase AlkB
LADLHLTPQVSDQVIVNEYQGKQGIAPHIDCKPCFADGIAMLSLLESWEMVFRKENGGAKLGQVLERRSVAVMTGEARYEWSHEIPKRKTERKVLRERRVSITFRRVLTQ